MHQFSEDAEALSLFLHDKTPDYDPELDRPDPKLDQAEKNLYDSLPSRSSPPNKSLMNLTAREMGELGYHVKSPNPPVSPQPQTHRPKRNATKNSKPKTSKPSKGSKSRSSSPKTSETKRSKTSKVLKSRSSSPKTSETKRPKTSKVLKSRSNSPSRVIKRESSQDSIAARLRRRGSNTDHRGVSISL
ncbi:hypothetical protein TWF102_006966 [Orbilia oligospora]|uniref:Uncharacterized protein n=1 Tax=Orbilia oligospora TaxID=2813651 RepID=A0A7C8NL00_ORBOL|nr:hypothetical protein TWF103_005839 [Orbilia oligospora]KAF3111293.1 hypothetical protein TWF102_006966 [Orbilia oligospora]